LERLRSGNYLHDTYFVLLGAAGCGRWPSVGSPVMLDSVMSSSIPPDGREVLRSALADLLPVADALEARALRDAAEACIVVLESPGRLDKRTLAPLLKLTHEQAAEVFRQGARESTGAFRRKLERSVARAEAEAASVQRVLSEGDLEAPS
jgi:hypothetical protein